MSETPNAVPAASKEDQLKSIEQVRELFGRAHDYLAQATYPGHMGIKVAEVLNFLSFQFADFKNRGEQLAKVIEAEKKAAASVVDVPAAQAATAEALAPEAPKA